MRVRYACRPVFKRVLYTALTPTINMLSVAGLISIPGMMTGQILAGGDAVVSGACGVEEGSGGPFGLATASIAAMISSRTALLQLDAEGPPPNRWEREGKTHKTEL